MKRLLIITALSPLTLAAQNTTLSVSNTLSYQRTEIVSYPVSQIRKALGCDDKQQLVVSDGGGMEVPYQITGDGLLLIEASVAPLGTATYSVRTGWPRPVTTLCTGRLFPERADDFTWENDRVIYRFYGPALERSGEKAWGTDVWLKSTPYPVLEKRYREHNMAYGQQGKLKREGRKAEADSLIMSYSFHIDHGEGMDCYAVGPTAGCGAPLLVTRQGIDYPRMFTTSEVLDEGPLRFKARFTYAPRTVDGRDGVVEHRTITLDKNSYYCRLDVTYDNLPKKVRPAAGLVVHRADTTSITLSDGLATYADPTQAPRQLSQQIYTGLIFTDSDTEVSVNRWPGNKGDIYGEIVGKNKTSNSNSFTYYFGSAWSKAGPHTFDEWNLHSRIKRECLLSPLKVEMK